MTWVLRALALISGAYVCVLASFVHRMESEVAGGFVPWGLVLGVATTYLLGVAWSRWRLCAEMYAIGWALGLGVGLGVGSDSYLITVDALGVVFLVGGFGSLFLVLWRASRL